MDELVLCSKCKQEKPRTAFPRHKANPSGLQAYCKSCARTCAPVRYVRDPEIKKKERDAYRLRYPEKRRADNLVYLAVRRGDLLKQPCEVCGEKKVHAHHDDYSKPLSVRWLCPTHHMRLHKYKGAA